MTAPSRLARGAAKVLAAEEIGQRSVPVEERKRTVDAVRAELERRSTGRRRRRWLLPLAFAAAAAALALGGTASWRSSTSAVVTHPARPSSVVAGTVRGSVFVVQNGERRALHAGASLSRGSSVVAVDGEALLVLRSDSKLDVEHATTATLLDDGETELIDLERGALTSTVTKRGAGQRFIVRTAEAEVEVRGTVFRVSRLPDERCGARTRVHVDEGRVVVRALDGATLERGGEWSSRCEVAPSAPATASTTEPASAAPEPSAKAVASPVTAPRGVATATRPSGSAAAAASASASATGNANEPPTPVSSSSELAAQNALFADAMASKGRGDTRSALASLEFLLDKYPRTPLREAAEAQRMVLVAGTDRARAAALAASYLARYPHGFARADAEKISRDGP